MNKPSDNFYAEMLTKGLGAQFAGGGTTALGVKAESAFLVSLGLGAKTFRLTDGSGLSYYDRLTTLDITRLLTAMSRRTDWKAFWHSLSVAGVDGTLPARMRGTAARRNLRGKTGTLTNASNLSGFVKAANGDWLVFSMLMNKKRDQRVRGPRRPGRDRRRPGLARGRAARSSGRPARHRGAS